MKSIKNLLVMGVILVIAFASVQMSAMEEGRRVNPKLSAANRELLEMRIKNMEKTIKSSNQFTLEEKADEIKRLENAKHMYYGNYPYSRFDILRTDL